MLCEPGFIPIGSALKDWRAVIDIKFENELAINLIDNDSQKASAQDDFNKHQKENNNPEYDYANLFEYVRAQHQSIARRNSLFAFRSQLRKQEIYLFDGTRTLFAAPEILEDVSEEVFYNIFWDQEFYQFPQDKINLSTVRKYISLPVFNSFILCFVDPYTWSIDLRGFEVIRERIAQIINPLRLGAMLDMSKYGYLSEFLNIQTLVENGILHDDDDETLTNTTDEQIMEFSKFIFPFLRNIQLKSLRHYEGASLCLEKDCWQDVLKLAQKTPYDNSIPPKSTKRSRRGHWKAREFWQSNMKFDRGDMTYPQVCNYLFDKTGEKPDPKSLRDWKKDPLPPGEG